MRFVADLHVHTRYSRATSKDCDLEHMAISAQCKGIRVLGTGDLTHPAWRAELREKLVPAGEGVFRLRDDLARAVAHAVPGSCRGEVRFLLGGEISTIYKKGEKTRKVHHLVLLPSLEAAADLSTRLGRIGNLASDGRPILGLDSRHLLELVLATDPSSYLVPAHVWTPWFAVLGSQSGFDSVEECYADLAPHVFAVETGLSSDPPMNRRVSSLDRFRLISSSDAHSPGKLGREATVFYGEPDFPAIRAALEQGRGYVGTVEFFPEEGKYHLDGHRKCAVRLEPERTRELGGRCPVCGRPVTVGVMSRVEALADRSEPARPATAGELQWLIPLEEILGEVRGAGPGTKGVQQARERLLRTIGPELFVLADAPLEDLARHGGATLAEAIGRLRRGEVFREAGYDGEYGVIRLFGPGELEGTSLFALPAMAPRPAVRPRGSC